LKDYSTVTFIANSKHNIFLKGFTMKKLSSKLNLVAGRVDSRTIRLIVTVASLVMFVLAAGAPHSVGGVGMQ
jgi:hypothetical protein